MEERRRLFSYLSKDDIPSSATVAATNVEGFNVIYYPLNCPATIDNGSSISTSSNQTFNSIGIYGKLNTVVRYLISIPLLRNNPIFCDFQSYSSSNSKNYMGILSSYSTGNGLSGFLHRCVFSAMYTSRYAGAYVTDSVNLSPSYYTVGNVGVLDKNTDNTSSNHGYIKIKFEKVGTQSLSLYIRLLYNPATLNLEYPIYVDTEE